MAEGKKLFSFDWGRFNQIWDLPNCINLQHEFLSYGIALSRSLLGWSGESGNEWLLADLESEKTYDIKLVNDAAGNPSAEVWERPSHEEKLLTSRNAEYILSQLQAAQGTNRGLIELVTRLDLEELDLERLKRADLSGARFSFELLQENLLRVHEMFRGILTSSRESLLDLSQDQLMAVNQHLQQFYEWVQQIEDFEIGGSNPREAHENLLQQISEFCDSTKQFLGDVLARLSSSKVNQLEVQVNTTVGKAVRQLNAETDRAKQINDEVERQKAEMQEEFDRLKLEVENQLAEKPISQYKAIFADQAKNYRMGAWVWLGKRDSDDCRVLWCFFLVTIMVERQKRYGARGLAKSFY